MFHGHILSGDKSGLGGVNAWSRSVYRRAPVAPMTRGLRLASYHPDAQVRSGSSQRLGAHCLHVGSMPRTNLFVHLPQKLLAHFLVYNTSALYLYFNDSLAEIGCPDDNGA